MPDEHMTHQLESEFPPSPNQSIVLRPHWYHLPPPLQTNTEKTASLSQPESVRILSPYWSANNKRIIFSKALNDNMRLNYTHTQPANNNLNVPTQTFVDLYVLSY